MRLLCGDDRHEVTLSGGSSAVEVRVDGTPFRMDVREVAPGTYVMTQDGRAETFHCVRDGDDIHLFWKGAVYRLVEEREGARRIQRAAASGLEAPMPGKVIKVSVEPGQAVAKGQEVLVIEAMKMENALRAPRDGTVRSVAARVGDMVAPGAVLVQLE